MLNIWIIIALHFVTLLALAGVSYFCFRLERKLTQVTKFFDTTKKAIPIDPDHVFIHLRDA